ncbi:MAG: hypothetical protein M3Q37_11090, partial [Gemmatimonadota bacterium]|nr:hypothetical protein [Gemmatimonadota bacterium]
PNGSDESDRLAKAADSGRLRFEFLVAPLLGRFERIGEVRIGSKLPEEMNAPRFNPFKTWRGPENPSDTLNRWRRDACPLSQRAWGPTAGRATVGISGVMTSGLHFGRANPSRFCGSRRR